MSTTFQNLRDRLAYRLGETSAATTNDRDAFLNEGQRYIINRLVDDAIGNLYIVTSMTSNASLKEYTIPAFLRVKEIELLRQSVPLVPIRDLVDISEMSNTSGNNFASLIGNTLRFKDYPSSTASGGIRFTAYRQPVDYTVEISDDLADLQVIFAHAQVQGTRENFDAQIALLNILDDQIQQANAKYGGVHKVNRRTIKRQAQSVVDGSVTGYNTTNLP